MRKHSLWAILLLMFLSSFAAAAAEKELFVDDFTAPESTAQWWSARKGAGFTATGSEGEDYYRDIVAVKDGRLRILAPQKEEWGAVILAGEAGVDAEVLHFVIETRMTFTRTQDTKNSLVGVVLWTGFTERVIFMQRPSGFYSFGRTEPIQESPLTSPPGFKSGLGEMVDVRIEVRANETGSEAAFYVNGEFVGARNFRALKGAAKIGLYTRMADAEFDYFRVTGL